MGAVIPLAAASAGAAHRLREVCDRLDPWHLGWESPSGEECARWVARERAAIARLAGELERVEQALRAAGPRW
jgi:hypothetical protein